MGRAVMSYIYIQSEENLWTVGVRGPNGMGKNRDFHPESDHDTEEAAAERTAWLNGARPMDHRPSRPANWHDDYDNVVLLGRHLCDHEGYDAKQLQHFYEKPWKWGAEWKALQAVENKAREQFEREHRVGM
jgi:hypothetical protein